ncbi:uncharacterized protein LOC107416162 [Ziziphus jujuba]|uniref:Uncharacterized protein LOC107416162 n=2 Tax=Ziziphus jujuba TaxID=326968 RepID=A0A6P3ZWW6_ZIZJJ|nr:uncharacterized protein LOC107416162 [Ziziphus jujuba]KAH7533878.1 hypothetical protein FEM48_Zijuj04G0178400 [Ziziphus jujuba var. spinosa]
MLNFLRPREPKALFYVGMALTLPHHSLLLPRSLSLRKTQNQTRKPTSSFPAFRCSSNPNFKTTLKTCKNCKTQFDPSLNHPRACRFHTAHFGGETKRKFESVYTGGTMDSPDSGQVFQYWHCCGSEDPFDPGCTAAPHSSYDD